MMNEAKHKISLRRNREYKEEQQKAIKSPLNTDELAAMEKEQRTRALENQKLVIKKNICIGLEEKVKKISQIRVKR